MQKLVDLFKLITTSILSIICCYSCFDAKGDIHPEYVDIELLQDSTSFPLQPMLWEGEKRYLSKTVINNKIYYKTDVNKDNNSITIYFDKKGNIIKKYNYKKTTGTDGGDRGETIKGKVILYSPHSDYYDLLFDFDKGIITDTIFYLSANFFLKPPPLYSSYEEYIDPPQHYRQDYYKLISYKSENEDKEIQELRDIMQRAVNKFPKMESIDIPRPFPEDFTKDSIGYNQYYEASESYRKKAYSIFSDYIKNLAMIHQNDIYSYDNGILFEPMKAVIKYPPQELPEYPVYMKNNDKDESPEGNEIILALEESVVESYSAGTGRGNLWNTNYLYYHTLIHNKDTIRFKSKRKYDLISYELQKQKYILLLEDNRRYQFFEFTPVSEKK